jgi:hypothetical protein
MFPFIPCCSLILWEVLEPSHYVVGFQATAIFLRSMKPFTSVNMGFTQITKLHIPVLKTSERDQSLQLKEWSLL